MQHFAPVSYLTYKSIVRKQKEERAGIRHGDRKGVMNRVFKIDLFFLSFALLFFTGCSLEGEGSVIYRVNYGRVEQGVGVRPDDLCIRLDNGTLLEVVEQLISTKELEDGSRLKFNYAELGKESDNLGSERCYIRLHNYTKLESDEVISSNELSEGPIEEIWRDPIKIENMWLGGRYLNVDFSIRKGIYSKEKHDVKLVYDQTSHGIEEREVARIYIKHNANGDVPTKESILNMVLVKSFISFDILSLIPEGDKSVRLEICWLEEMEGDPLGEPVRKELKGEFTPYGVAQENRWTDAR